ncbi:aminotransferase class I/II-fold pyridoxal phosphate-dependent enzyme [bacterium]|nr:aminotransferase class I/II-fold pyridoxal phosphate-dependent enzyme [bacterium]
MKIQTFQMERWQSEWEHQVDYNLSESGVHAFTLKELLGREQINILLQTKMGYIQTDGTLPLKKQICQYYPQSKETNILVTSGSTEANFLLMWYFLEPGDEAVVMLPNFMQIPGLMKSFGAHMKTFYLHEDLNWKPDIKKLKNLVTKNTKIIAVTNPNNPTGACLDEPTRQTLLELADWADAWLLSDEVYQGGELDGKTTPTFWNSYPKTVCVSGFSKAYGLPGLRIGWVVAPEELVQKVWPYKDYTTITVSALSDQLARWVLQSKNREHILNRGRKIIRENSQILESWIKQHNDLFSFIPPQAGAIAFVRYNLGMKATELAHQIREKKNVLVQPGDQMGMDGYIRVGLGEKKSYFKKALSLLGEGFKELKEI